MNNVLQTMNKLSREKRLTLSKMTAWFNVEDEKRILDLLDDLPNLPGISINIQNEVVAELYETTFDNEIRMLLSSLWIHHPTVLQNVVDMLHPDTLEPIDKDMNNIHYTTRLTLCLYVPTVAYFILLYAQYTDGASTSLNSMYHRIKPGVTKVTTYMKNHKNCGTTALVFPTGNVMYFPTRDECMMFLNRKLYGINTDLVLVTQETMCDEDVCNMNKMDPLPIMSVVANFENDVEYRKAAKKYRRYMFALTSLNEGEVKDG